MIRDRYRVQVVGKGRGGKTVLTGSQNLELSASAGFETHHGTVHIDTCVDTFVHVCTYSRISIVRGHQDRVYLELPKSSDYTVYDNIEHVVRCI